MADKITDIYNAAEKLSSKSFCFILYSQYTRKRQHHAICAQKFDVIGSFLIKKMRKPCVLPAFSSNVKSVFSGSFPFDPSSPYKRHCNACRGGCEEYHPHSHRAAVSGLCCRPARRTVSVRRCFCRRGRRCRRCGLPDFERCLTGSVTGP